MMKFETAHWDCPNKDCKYWNYARRCTANRYEWLTHCDGLPNFDLVRVMLLIKNGKLPKQDEVGKYEKSHVDKLIELEFIYYDAKFDGGKYFLTNEGAKLLGDVT